MDQEAQRAYWRESSRRYRERDPERSRLRNRRAALAHPESVKTSKKKWADANRDRVNEGRRRRRTVSSKTLEADRRWKAAHPEAVQLQGRKQNLKRYGLTIESYEARLIAQQNLCIICKKPETQKRHGKLRRLSVDHNHNTKQTRALLCSRCNKVIGLIRESPALLDAMKSYLLEWNAVANQPSG